MRIPFTLRILLVLAGLACLIGPALIARDRANTAVRPAASPSGAIVSGNVSITVVKD
jgi:hypothetical protein